MFGHRDDDVISKDQQADVDVSIPDDAVSTMAMPPDPAAFAQQDAPDNQAVQSDESQQSDDVPPVVVPEITNDPFSSIQSAPALDGSDVNSTESSEPALSDQTPLLSGFMQPSATDTADEPGPVSADDPNHMAETEQDFTDLSKHEEESEAPAPVDISEPAATRATPPQTVDAEELLHIKQDALQQLSPLVDQLEQEPEQKFRTLLMLIQASDNQALVSHAYKVALQIKDEKVRAQALLDVVNEINYFTHEGQKPEEK